jgi:hypothetical protein
VLGIRTDAITYVKMLVEFYVSFLKLDCNHVPLIWLGSTKNLLMYNVSYRSM